jgi:hypothetical protein
VSAAAWVGTTTTRLLDTLGRQHKLESRLGVRPVNYRLAVSLIILLVCLITSCVSQTETATVSGRISDEQGAVVPGAELVLTNVDTNLKTQQTSNKDGLYVFAGLKPGRYILAVSKGGFRKINLTDVVLNVQDAVSKNFQLQVGSVSESVTVVAESENINTSDGTVSTVVDRNFAENLPMNGRSFQTLIQLTPGVVLTQPSGLDAGQFSVNGQRASSNYWMVDGVSANVGVPVGVVPGNGLGGSLGSFSVLGGTNSLVSVDAMQEFRIQTSTYAPEFGRTPGGQISIVTRSGTNHFHGSAFDYLRNDVLDANNWFADNKGLPKPEERENDFGGTFSGPILKDRTFFFFSYEGFRLRLPQVALTTVPDINARQSAVPAMQPYLNAHPLPNGPEVLDSKGNATGAAQFNSSFSNDATLDSYSLRVDHRLTERLSLFGRYSYSPSELLVRGFQGFSLSTLARERITTQTATVGAALALSPTLANDLRFNYSRVSGAGRAFLDNFAGAVPLTSLPLPSPFLADNSILRFQMFSLLQGGFEEGRVLGAVQRQLNVVDNLTSQRSSHSLKFGIDFRRLTPIYNPTLYSQQVAFLNIPSSEVGNLFFSIIGAQRNATFLFHNLGIFAQDTWRLHPRLTITYGLRWDVDFAPSTTDGPNFPGVTGFNLNDLSQLALAPPGSPAFKTTYGNVAPRLGMAFQLSRNQNWQAVLRGGFGVFFDLATSETGNLLANLGYPFGASQRTSGGTFPLGPAASAPPPISAASLSSSSSTLNAFNPDLELPYSLQWNIAFEQALGLQQTISASYIGATGRRLLDTAFISSPNPNVGNANLVTNAGTSDYHALQFQFQRRLAKGLQGLSSYTWSHSIDTASGGSYNTGSDALVPRVSPDANRGPSDFDVRNAFSAGITYDVPAPNLNALTDSLLRGWSLQNFIQVRSAPPVNVSDSQFSRLFGGFTQIRPDIVPGQSFYLYGLQYPGGKALNPAAFSVPPLGSTGAPVRQGNLGRNAVRAFGAAQWDFAVHRDFPIRESLKLQFRAEMFNALNHPNFAPPAADIFNKTQFGRSNATLGQYLAGTFAGVAGGGLNQLYQIGGPRSIQLALKILF